MILGLTRAVPTLRRVISFDPVGGGAAAFGDLLNPSARIPEIPRPAPTDLSTIGYTSGTTGHPKGAMQSHRAVFLNTAALFAVQTRTDQDVMLTALPLPHVYGNIVMNGTFMAGRLQAAPLGPVRARSAEDIYGQGHAPGTEDARRLGWPGAGWSPPTIATGPVTEKHSNAATPGCWDHRLACVDGLRFRHE